MQVLVESPSQIQRRVTVVVPVEKLDQAFDQRINKLSKTLKINGFRPGKVPTEVVKQRYGDSARQEALSEVIQSSLYKAIDQEKLNIVGVPQVEPKTVFPGQPLEFVATFDVLPHIEKVHFDIATIEKHIATIEDEDINRVIEHLTSQYIKWKPVDRPSQAKDQITVDFNGKIDGVEFPGAKAKDYPIVLGSNTMIPGFEDGLLGCQVENEKTIQVTFPADYFAKDIAGKKAEFDIKVKKIMEPELPALDPEFIQKLGVKSGKIADLQTEIRKNLERELDRLIQAKLKAQVFEKLLEQNSIEIPNTLIKQEAIRLHDQLHHGQGEHHHTDEENKYFEDLAKRNVALGLIVGEIVKEHKIVPDLLRIQRYIERMSGNYENPEQVNQWYAKNKKALAEVQMQVLEEQTVEKLLETVQVTEKMISYNELVKSTQ